MGERYSQRILPGFFSQSDPDSVAFDSGALIGLGEFGLQGLQMVVVIVYGLSDGVNISGRVRGRGAGINAEPRPAIERGTARKGN